VPHSYPSGGPSAGLYTGPSPIQPSQQAGAGSHQTPMNHPTGSSLGGINFDSPSFTNAMNLNTVGMNISLSGMGMDGLGNIGLPMPGIGGGLSVRDDEDERRRRMEIILAVLGKKNGRVSEEGVERIARHLGMDAFGTDHRGARQLTIAGKSTMTEIDFKLDEVSKVDLIFADTSSLIRDVAYRAADVLKADLTPAKEVAPICTNLNAFADNMERIARHDKLSTLPDFDCFQAVGGIYTSLRRLFEHEKKKIMDGIRDSETSAIDEDERAEREVMCTKSGRPRMHARKRVGLTLEYWREKRHIGLKRKRDEDVDMEGSNTGSRREQDEDDDHKIWSVVIECEQLSSSLMSAQWIADPSLVARVSDDWISEKVEKPVESQEDDDLFGGEQEQLQVVDWLEPNPTYIRKEPAPEGDEMDLDAANSALTKLPDVRFVAKLEPPIILPLGAATELFQKVGSTVPMDSGWLIYDDLVLPPGQPSIDNASPRSWSKERDIVVVDKKGKSVEKSQRLNFHIPSREVGRIVTDVSFSHPKQLIEVLPVSTTSSIKSQHLKLTIPFRS
jgi:Mediator of RNA polymerase II transcription subunit 1